MNNENVSFTNQSERIGKLILQLQRLERNPRIFGDAGTLTPSEIHTVDAIGLAGAVRMGQLAERLGITKGAVTQLIDRLEGKELVLRTSHPVDSRAVLISLTKKGELAFQAHESMHQQFFQKLSKELDNKEIAIFEKGLQIFTEVLTDHHSQVD